jgi:tetratricopeptide (TPR) repeat protein
VVNRKVDSSRRPLPGDPPARLLLGVALAIAAICIAEFGRVVGFEFVGLDDYMYIVRNASLRDGLAFDGLVSSFRPRFSNWIPLTELSYRVDYALYGLEPGGYHLTNLLLHAAGASVLFLALAQMTGSVWRSCLVAVIFGIHPLHVESVAWVSERKDVLAGLLFMLTVQQYGRYRERRSWGHYGAVLTFFALSLLAKPMVVTLPFVLLLLDYWPLERFTQPARARTELGRALLEKLPLFALAAAASAVTFSVQRSSGTMTDLVQLPLDIRLSNAVLSYAHYLRDAAWPLELAAFYPHPLDAIDATELAVCGLVLMCATGAALRFSSARGYLAVGWLWYLGTLVPVIGIVQVGMQARADRYMYLPLIGLSIAIVWGLAELAERLRVPPQARVVAAVTAVAALAVTTWSQLDTWRNTEALYAQALSVTEGNYLAHRAMGNERLRQERIPEAAEHFERALELVPEWQAPRLGLADVELKRGHTHRALAAYKQALDRAPTDTGVAGRYGLALGLVGRFDEARAYIRQALAGHDGTAELHRALADIEAALGNVSSAQHHAREALRLAPDYADAANSLAWLLATAADPALRNAKEAIAIIEPYAIGSEASWLLDTLAAAYAADGRFEVATETAERAARLATEQGRSAEVDDIRERIALFRTHRAWVEKPR